MAHYAAWNVDRTTETAQSSLEEPSAGESGGEENNPVKITVRKMVEHIFTPRGIGGSSPSPPTIFCATLIAFFLRRFVQ